jgi:hypothetical protein
VLPFTTSPLPHLNNSKFPRIIHHFSYHCITSRIKNITSASITLNLYVRVYANLSLELLKDTMADLILLDAPAVETPEHLKATDDAPDGVTNVPATTTIATASTVITQSTTQFFWSTGMTAYACPEKPAGHVWLRVREFVGNKSTKKVTVIPPVVPSTSEKGGGLGSHGVSMALWVGMRPSSADSLRTRAARGKEKVSKSDGARPKVAQEDISKAYGKSVYQIIANGQYHLVQYDPQALRVV